MVWSLFLQTGSEGPSLISYTVNCLFIKQVLLAHSIADIATSAIPGLDRRELGRKSENLKNPFGSSERVKCFGSKSSQDEVQAVTGLLAIPFELPYKGRFFNENECKNIKRGGKEEITIRKINLLKLENPSPAGRGVLGGLF